MIKCVIVEDDKMSQMALVDTLAAHCRNVEVVAVCDTPEDGVRAIGKLFPTLVLLDIEMPGMSGFEMLKLVGDIDFEVIFTTSYNEYVLDAIRSNAFDYLIKPVKPEELKASVERLVQKRVRSRNQKFEQLAESLSSGNKNRRIALPTFEGYIFIYVRDIVHCKSESNYTTIHMSGGDKILVTRTLKEIEESVNSADFFRVHNSHFVNLASVKKYIRGSGGYLVMNDGATINIARNRKDKFLKVLERF
jgi:two-component system, LytTR family, response regulator